MVSLGGDGSDWILLIVTVYLTKGNGVVSLWGFSSHYLCP